MSQVETIFPAYEYLYSSDPANVVLAVGDEGPLPYMIDPATQKNGTYVEDWASNIIYDPIARSSTFRLKNKYDYAYANLDQDIKSYRYRDEALISVRMKFLAIAALIEELF